MMLSTWNDTTTYTPMKPNQDNKRMRIYHTSLSEEGMTDCSKVYEIIKISDEVRAVAQGKRIYCIVPGPRFAAIVELNGFLEAAWKLQQYTVLGNFKLFASSLPSRTEVVPWIDYVSLYWKNISEKDPLLQSLGIFSPRQAESSGALLASYPYVKRNYREGLSFSSPNLWSKCQAYSNSTPPFSQTLMWPAVSVESQPPAVDPVYNWNVNTSFAALGCGQLLIAHSTASVNKENVIKLVGDDPDMSETHTKVYSPFPVQRDECTIRITSDFSKYNKNSDVDVSPKHEPDIGLELVTFSVIIGIMVYIYLEISMIRFNRRMKQQRSRISSPFRIDESLSLTQQTVLDGSQRDQEPVEEGLEPPVDEEQRESCTKELIYPEDSNSLGRHSGQTFFEDCIERVPKVRKSWIFKKRETLLKTLLAGSIPFRALFGDTGKILTEAEVLKRLGQARKSSRVSLSRNGKSYKLLPKKSFRKSSTKQTRKSNVMSQRH